MKMPWTKPTADQDALDRIDDAVRSMLKTEPFFAHVALGFTLQETGEIKTCSTDGQTLYYNKDYIKSLEPKHLKGLLAHETLHAAYRHPHRGMGLIPSIWNIAADVVVNHTLGAHGFQLPPGADIRMDSYAIDPITKKPRSVEEIYNLLLLLAPPHRPNEGEAPKSGCVEAPSLIGQKHQGPEPGKPGDQDGDEDQDEDGLQHEMKKRVIKAAMQARKQGKMPGDLEHIIEEMLHGQKDWRDTLRRFLGGGEIPEQSWSRPNRRYIADGDYLPGNAKHGAGEVVAVLDSSGSIDDDLWKRMVAELRKLHEDLATEKIHVLVCDARIQSAETFGPYDALTASCKGRGGTDFRPVWNWIKANNIEPRALVYFTDGEGQFPTRSNFPTLWVVWPGGAADSKFPFGEVVRMSGAA